MFTCFDKFAKSDWNTRWHGHYSSTSGKWRVGAVDHAFIHQANVAQSPLVSDSVFVLDLVTIDREQKILEALLMVFSEKLNLVREVRLAIHGPGCASQVSMLQKAFVDEE